MGIISIGSNQYKHYHRLSERCRLMSCQRAGVNIDYFTLVVRAAGLTAAPYSKEISDDDEYLDMLGNGTADVGWALRRQDPVLLEKVFFTLPVTGVSYGYVTAEDRTKIRDVLDKLQWDGVTALIWPKFRLHLYCKFDECERWKQLANTRTIMAPDTSEAYFARLAKETNAIGFASIGDELLRANVIVYNRRAHQLFVVDESLTRQPFSFTISKKRRDLVEPLNRAIALTYSIYPRIMARYVPPYGVYSKQVVDMQWTPLSISSFDVIWQFEII
ncbi:hypothetical protein PFISCL1PPCAC_23752, partial [Pristionchus fissidentatus]